MKNVYFLFAHEERQYCERTTMIFTLILFLSINFFFIIINQKLHTKNNLVYVEHKNNISVKIEKDELSLMLFNQFWLLSSSDISTSKSEDTADKIL